MRFPGLPRIALGTALVVALGSAAPASPVEADAQDPGAALFDELCTSCQG